MKNCSKCGLDLALKNFYVRNKRTGNTSNICKKCHSISNKNWRTNNPEKTKAIHDLWRLKNGDKLSKRNVEEQSFLRKSVIEKLGGKCVRCNFSEDIRALQIDHVNGGGNKFRRTRNWRNFYKGILSSKSAEKVQILCANCNWIKRIENKES